MKNNTSILIASLIILVAGIMTFLFSLHTLDTSFNMLNLEKEYNISFYDKSLDRKIYSTSELWNFGINEIFISFVFLIIGSFMVGYNLQ